MRSTLEQLLELDEDVLMLRLAAAMEPRPADVSARALRSHQPGFVWVSTYSVPSPGGWWQAEIGTDHGPVEADDNPARWRPSRYISDPALPLDIAVALKARGWLMHFLQMSDGWVVNAKEYRLPADGDWQGAVSSGGFEQVPADELGRAATIAAILITEQLRMTVPAN